MKLKLSVYGNFMNLWNPELSVLKDLKDIYFHIDFYIIYMSSSISQHFCVQLYAWALLKLILYNFPN